jgi:DNA-directed RNA polymerase specialized sigma24 family protein
MSRAQPPYNDIESLIRAAYGESARVAFGIVRNHADAEDAMQSACIKVLLMWPRVSGLATAGKQKAYLLRTVRNEASWPWSSTLRTSPPSSASIPACTTS